VAKQLLSYEGFDTQKSAFVTAVKRGNNDVLVSRVERTVSWETKKKDPSVSMNIVETYFDGKHRKHTQMKLGSIRQWCQGCNF